MDRPDPNSFSLYTAPAGPGKVTPAGPGKVVPAGRGTGHWRTYDVTDGLASTIVRSILQDREGNLWFGTLGGVSLYDGQTWTTYTAQDGLADNQVNAILQDREGNLWFGTRGGVSRYEGSEKKGQSWTTFTVNEGLAHNLVMSILQDRRGRLWFGTYGGVSLYDGQGWTTYTTQEGLADDRVNAILQDREGNLWFGTLGGVSLYDGQSWTTYTTQEGLADDRVNAILQDREGNLWFGAGDPRGDGGGASRYDGKTFTTFTAKDGLAANGVTSILQDREGHLWFGIPWNGVSLYDGQAWTTYTTQEGLAGNWVWAMLQDREGNLWFGTSGGVSRYDGQIITFTIQDGLASNNVRSVFQDREGNLWFGTNTGGVNRYDGKDFTAFTPEEGLAGNMVMSIFQDREGNLWFGTSNGVSLYDGQTWTTFTTQDGLAHNSVMSILQDREGNYWFGTGGYGAPGGGVSLYDGQTWTTFTTQDGLASNNIRSILQDREGHFWFSTEGGGVSRYDGKVWTTFTTKDGLAHDLVMSVFEDQEGNYWFGTGGYGAPGGGVSLYDGKTHSADSEPALSETKGQAWTTFTTKDGLAGNWVSRILQGREGHLWFGTFGGVSRYDGQVFQTLTRQDGLANNVVFSILQDREGVLWFGTLNGLTRYRPPAPSPPPAFIDAVVADRRYERASELAVPSSVKLTGFEFHGMSFKTRPEQMVYRYRLKGYEEEWRNTHERRVEYQDLPVGDYTFEVLAVDRDLVYSEKPAIVKLTVVPDPRIEALTETLSRNGASGEFVGRSEALRKVQTQLSWVAQTDVMVLVLGETGTGKGLAARAVHAMGERRAGPFIQVNCGAIPEGLVESELFGHEKGAFTGAVSRKLGKAELAEGGTLFLDEIGDLPPEAQVKLLRFLEERTFERVGGTQTLKADARVIAATNRDLRGMVSEGKFREDLYFRITTFPVRLPPLRERREDISVLAAYFTERMAAHLNKNVTHLTSEALSLLYVYDWPGNVRELEHTIQRAVIVCQGSAIRPEDILLESGRTGGGRVEEVATMEEVERRHIRETLERTGWVIRGPRGAAALLGLHESTLRSRMKKLDVRRP